MTRRRSRFVLVATTLALVLASSSEGRRAASPPGPYVLTDLGTLGGLSAQANDLNQDGEVVGYATNASSRGRAYVWSNGTMTDLGTLGGPNSTANAINDAGQVVGSAGVNSSQQTHAVLWSNGATIDLTPGAEQGAAYGINNLGQVVGLRNHWIPFLWHNGVATDLPHLGGGGGWATDINDAGQAVGSSSTTIVTALGPMPHAVLWQNGTATDLGVLPGEQDSGASAINNAGQIVGSSGSMDPDSYEIRSRAFRYENGVMTALPVPSTESYAADINDHGVIVGTMRTGGGLSKFHAYVYADGVVTNLNSLIPAGSGLHLAYAYGINNAGQIAGVALDAQSRYHAFLLTPAAVGTPVIDIADASITEGHTGTARLDLTIKLSTASSSAISVAYATANGVAVAGSDYEPASGSVTFEAGQTSKTISVLVTGDRVGEANETFVINLMQASAGAVIGDGQATATIVDDEPRVSIGDVTKNEGSSGVSAFTFTVRLTSSSAVAVQVPFATANASARSGEDYEAKSGVVTFAPGETSKTFAVNVIGDRKREGDEVFYVNLGVATGAVVLDREGAGVIKNDDR